MINDFMGNGFDTKKFDNGSVSHFYLKTDKNLAKAEYGD